MTREIDLQRRDGHIAVLDGVKISTRSCILPGAGRTDPIHRSALRILLRHDRFRPVTKTQPGRLKTGELLPRQIRHIDVQNRVRRQWLSLQLLHQRCGSASGSIKVVL